MTLRPGWLNRQLTKVAQDVAVWPDWVKKQATEGNKGMNEQEAHVEKANQKRSDIVAMLKDRIAELKQQLAETEAACAEMREALQLASDCACGKFRDFYGVVESKMQHALSLEAGKAAAERHQRGVVSD